VRRQPGINISLRLKGGGRSEGKEWGGKPHAIENREGRFEKAGSCINKRGRISLKKWRANGSCEKRMKKGVQREAFIAEGEDLCSPTSTYSEEKARKELKLLTLLRKRGGGSPSFSAS